MLVGGSLTALLFCDQTSHGVDARAGAQRDCYRTIWAAPHLRAARALWSESGGRGGVSDLGGGEQPTPEANVASTSRSPSARTRNVAEATAHREQAGS